MASIRQVAALAGVSTATVSRTLKLPDVVSKATRDQVMAAVRKLGYTPNSMARNLRTARSHLVLVLVPDIGNPFFSDIIKGMEQVAHARNYSLLVGDTQDSLEREQEYADRVMARQADGLITLNGRIPLRNYREQLKRGFALPPVVSACERNLEKLVPNVGIDNRAAAVKATQYLLGLGHRRIAFVTGPASSNLCAERLAGYRKALQAAGIKERKELIVGGDYSAESGISATKQLLALDGRPTAVFCSNDEMAFGVIKTLKTHGMSIPAQMSVLGFDDIPLARYLDPALTTIQQPKLDIGRESMKILCDMIDGNGGGAGNHVLPFQLLVRDSTGRPPSTR